MKALKIVGLVVLGFLLFVSLSLFGLAFTLNNTLLNPRFIPAQVDRLDISALVDEGLGEAGQTDLPVDVRSALITTVDKLEPAVKAQLREASSRVYDYLLGRTGEIDLAAILKDTVLSKQFIASAVTEADVTTLVRESLGDELVDLIPPDLTIVERLALARYLDEALPGIDPWIRDQVELASGPVVDYLLGDSPTLRVVVDLEPMKTTLKTSLREAFLRSPPPGIPQSQLNDVFNQVYDQFAVQVPATATIDAASLGMDASVSIAGTVADIEAVLKDVRTAFGVVRTAYVLLIVLTVLLIAGIVLIHRQVRGAARDLGIVFLVYGAMEYVGILIGKYFIRSALLVQDVPATMQAWLPGLVADSFRPLEVLSLSLVVVGVALIVVSIVYRRTPATS